MLLDAKYFLKNNRNIMFFKLFFYKIFIGELIFELQRMCTNNRRCKMKMDIRHSQLALSE